MSQKWIAICLMILGCTAAIAAAVLYIASNWSVLDAMPGLPMLTIGSFGAVIIANRPGNRIGWIMLAGGLTIAGASLADAYARYSANQTSLPREVWGWWIASWAFLGGYLIIIVGLAFFFPAGCVLSPRWRPVVAVAAVTWTIFVAGLAFTPGQLSDDTDKRNPAGLGFMENLDAMVGTLFAVLVVAVLLTMFAALILRIRRSSGIQRQQVKWLIWVLTAALLTHLVGESLRGTVEVLGSILTTYVSFLIFVLGVPAAITVAILRHDLFDIDRLINRSVVYLLLTIALTTGYLGLIIIFGGTMRAATGGESSVAIMLSTLIVAALFRPLRTRIQGLVDRRFYRGKYDATRTLEAFSERLRDQVDLETLSGELQDVVVRTVQPAQVAVWYRPTGPHNTDGKWR